MAWLVDKRPIPGRREGSIGTIIYFRASCLSFFLSKKKKKRERKCEEKWQEDIGT